MTPLETLLGKLSDARQSGDGWVARCPAHDDQRPSLSIREGDDGRVLLKCHAGCETSAVLAALGLEWRDLFPAGGAPRAGPKPPAKGQVFATALEAIAALEKQLGKRSALWTYHDAHGQSVGVVVRWDGPAGKTIRPVAWHADGWHIGAMPAPRPLYRLPELMASPSRQVWVLEGEKCADAARRLGLLATTSAGGAGAADKTDWSPLAGQHVVIVPDHDASGRRYAEDVARLCHAAGAASIRVLDLSQHAPQLPEGGDLADLLADERWCGLGLGDAAEAADCVVLLERLAAAVEPWRPTDSPTAPQAATAARTRWRPDLVCLGQIEPQSVPWLWYSRIALGRLTLLVGRPGCGKSFVACDLAARVSTGAPWPGGGGDRAPLGDTLLLSAEDDPADTLRPRLNAAGADCRRVHLLRGAVLREEDGKERSVALDLSNVDLIRDTLAQLPACKLIVIDPIGNYLRGQVDAHRDNEVRSVLVPLALLAAERAVAVVLVVHTRKTVAGYADDMVLGSRAFVGLSRSVLHLGTDPDDERRKLLLPGKCNLCAPPPGLAFRIVGDPGRLEWEPDPVVGISADDLVVPAASRESRRGPRSEDRDRATEWLADLLRYGPLPVGDIREQAKAAGLSWATVRRAQEALGIVPRRQGFAGSGGWWWGLPLKDAQVFSKDAQVSPQRCSSFQKLEHLWRNTGEMGQNSQCFTKDAQVSGNLSTFGKNLSIFEENLSTFEGIENGSDTCRSADAECGEQEPLDFPFGWNNPADPDNQGPSSGRRGGCPRRPEAPAGGGLFPAPGLDGPYQERC